MKENLTDVTILVDASGSMLGLREETVKNINEFIEEQRKEPGYLNLTIYQFDTNLRETLPLTDIRDVRRITTEDYVPGGMTALLDALGTVIDRTGTRLRSLPESQRPGKVVILTITDGQENSSTEYYGPQVAKMVTHQQDKYNWSFAFLGANIDSFAVGGQLGIRKAATMNYVASAAGLESSYRTMSKSLSTHRGAPVGAIFAFTDDDSTADNSTD